MKQSFRRLSCVVAGFLIISLPASALQNFEAPQTLQASRILTPELLKGPNHEVDEKVINDGYLNIYTIHSSMGDVQATSTDKLKKYVNEINAAVAMSKVETSGEFTEAVKATGGRVVEGAKNIVTDPIGSVSGAVSGVGALFKRAGASVGGQRSDQEDSALKAAIGFSTAKREYAYEFGVDAYSRNQIMQEQLDSLTWAGASGGIAASAALMMVPGGAGIAVSVTSGTEVMNKVFRNVPPSELRIKNREKLAAMGINQDIIDLYIKNSIYTPREQSIIVFALEAMPGTKNRNDYIKFAVLTNHPDIAFFRQRQAQMYEAYNRLIQPIDSFVSIGEIAAAKTADNKIVFNVPLDYLLWTKNMASLVSVLNQKVTLMEGIKEKHLWVAGTVSDVAKSSLDKMGWKVFQKAGPKLLPDPF